MTDHSEREGPNGGKEKAGRRTSGLGYRDGDFCKLRGEGGGMNVPGRVKDEVEVMRGVVGTLGRGAAGGRGGYACERRRRALDDVNDVGNLFERLLGLVRDAIVLTQYSVRYDWWLTAGGQ